MSAPLRKKKANSDQPDASRFAWHKHVKKLLYLQEQLIIRRSLDDKLKIITDGIVDIFDADFARIWLVEAGDLCNNGCRHATVSKGPDACKKRTQCLHLRASSGRYTHIDGGHSRVPLGCYRIGRIAAGKDIHFLTNDVTQDPLVQDPQWARGIGLVSFAGYRLLSIEGLPIGVLALFKKHVILPDEETLLQNLANTTSQVIAAGKAEEALSQESMRNRILMDKSLDGIAIINQKHKVVDANLRFCENLGYTRDEVLGLHTWDFEALMTEADIRNNFSDLTKTNVVFETRHRRKDGTAFDVEVSATGTTVDNEPMVLTVSRDITDRKKAEDEMQKLSLIVKHSSELINLATLDGKMIFLNEAGRKMLGIDSGVLGPRNILDFIPDHLTDFAKSVVLPILKKGGQWEGELQYRHLKTGELIDVHAITFPINDPSSRKPLYLANVSLDISERKKAEESLRESEEFSRTIFEYAAGSMVLVNKEGRFFHVNRAACNMFGYSPSEMIKKQVLDVTHPDDLEKSRAFMRELRQGKRDHGLLEKRYIHKDGHVIWGLLSGSAVCDAQGNFLYSVSEILDITERKKTEEALRESERRLKTILDSIPTGIMLIDREKHIIMDVNPEAARMIGAKRENLLGTVCHSHVCPAELGKCPITDLGQTLDNSDRVLLTADGQQRSILKTVVPVTIRGREHLLESFVDITERKESEEALRRSEEELHNSYFDQAAINLILRESMEDLPLEMILQKALVMMLSVPWLSFEPIGSIHLVEGAPGQLSLKAQYNLPGYLKKSCAHISFGQCLCGKAAQTRELLFADCIDERHEISYEGMKSHGHYIVPILFRERILGVIDIYLKEGHRRDKKEEDFLLTIADTLGSIIIRRQAEAEKEKLHAQLLQSQKMEAVGLLAGGIAHDFNNILTAMIGYGHMLKIKMKEHDPLRIYPDHILDLSEKAANLTQNLLAFSRKQIINPKQLDLNEVIRKINHLLSRIIGEDIQLKTSLSRKALPVMADSGQLEQVLMNLAANARDAMPDGGILTIKTERVELDQEFVKTLSIATAGTYACISISDTGAGMDKETLEKIFEPFYTTKELGKGTGLGLAMVYGIINQHEGYITVHSEPGKGTTFSIYLPLLGSQMKERKPEAILPAEKGSETILLAEDGKEVRDLTKHLLEDNGYRVIAATDGQDAIKKFKAHKNDIHLALLDVIMPIKNGKEVYNEIKQIKPGIKVLFMSGHPAAVIHKKGIIEKEFAYIEKPASPTKLFKKIREVLRK